MNSLNLRFNFLIKKRAAFSNIGLQQSSDFMYSLYAKLNVKRKLAIFSIKQPTVGDHVINHELNFVKECI